MFLNREIAKEEWERRSKCRGKQENETDVKGKEENIKAREKECCQYVPPY